MWREHQSFRLLQSRQPVVYKWDLYVVPKRRQEITTIHCVTAHKRAVLIDLAAET